MQQRHYEYIIYHYEYIIDLHEYVIGLLKIAIRFWHSVRSFVIENETTHVGFHLAGACRRRFPTLRALAGVGFTLRALRACFRETGNTGDPVKYGRSGNPTYTCRLSVLILGV